MFVDASAVIAVVARESDAAAIAARLGRARTVYTSPVAIYESVLGLARIGNTSIADAVAVLERFLEEIHAEIIPITAELGRGAIGAFARYGKGRHPAKLNMGDCFAYACAENLHVPLLFKGDDFPQTDIAAA